MALFQKIYVIKYKNERNNKTNEKRTWFMMVVFAQFFMTFD